MTLQQHPPAHLLERTLALAALLQAVQLIESISRTGLYDAVQFNTSIESIFATADQPMIQIYQSAEQLRGGLLLGSKVLQGLQIDKAKSIMTYCSTIMALEKKLQKQPETLKQIAQGFQNIQKQQQYFASYTHHNILAAISNLYGETVSQVKPRIIIHGTTEHLGLSSNKDRVRSLLFAAIRAAYLWRKHGGNQIQLLISRKKIVNTIEYLLKKC
ncbi:MAG: high frequency lysogenization protein HflD [Zetaproteobacteria bacterium]|nr:high frequency lysogenization protein HflD [Zetaproteobacteria bacterium]